MSALQRCLYLWRRSCAACSANPGCRRLGFCEGEETSGPAVMAALKQSPVDIPPGVCAPFFRAVFPGHPLCFRGTPLWKEGGAEKKRGISRRSRRVQHLFEMPLAPVHAQAIDLAANIAFPDGGSGCNLLGRVRRNVDDLKTSGGRESLPQDIIEQADTLDFPGDTYSSLVYPIIEARGPPKACAAPGRGDTYGPSTPDEPSALSSVPDEHAGSRFFLSPTGGRTWSIRAVQGWRSSQFCRFCQIAAKQRGRRFLSPQKGTVHSEREKVEFSDRTTRPK
jgi:hypothetical protein